MTDAREVRAAAIGFAIVAVYMALVLLTGRVDPADFLSLLSNYLLCSLTLFVGAGMFALAVLLYANRPRGGRPGPSPFTVIARWGAARWARDRGVSLLWPPLLFALLMASFNAFKQMVLPLAGFAFDPAFAAADRLLFLGHDPWQVTHAILPGAVATDIVDRSYHGWFAPMSLGVIACAWLSTDSFELRTRYLLSYIAIWILLGSVLAFLLSAAGPCFYLEFAGPSPSFQALGEQLTAQQDALGHPISALTIQRGLLHVQSQSALAMGGGISAMPSVHNALAVLFALAGFGIHRVAGWAMTAFAAVIWIGSIHLGWHYAIDGIVAAALAIGIWRITGRIAARLAEPAPERLRKPAMA